MGHLSILFIIGVLILLGVFYFKNKINNQDVSKSQAKNCEYYKPGLRGQCLIARRCPRKHVLCDKKNLKT